MIDVEAAPIVLRSVFPAEVTLPDGQYLRLALVKVTRRAVYVWHGERALVFAEEHTTDPATMPHEYRLRAEALQVDTTAGVVVVNRGTGCGCSHSLKSFQPFQPDRRARQ